MKKTQGGKREMSVRQALEWAFGTEHAQLDFDDLRPEGARPGRDTIATMMQRGALGCEIDGGGRSRPADDAETIANTLACLPVALGGRSMAADMAMWARVGIAPDWMKDATTRCVPVGWRNTKHGDFAKTETLRVETVVYRGRKTSYEVVVCPVTYVMTSQQIGRARRQYLDWYGALLHMAYALGVQGLSTIRLNDRMPPMTPWRAPDVAGERAA